jgi:hypothetical protein
MNSHAFGACSLMPTRIVRYSEGVPRGVSQLIPIIIRRSDSVEVYASAYPVRSC